MWSLCKWDFNELENLSEMWSLCKRDFNELVSFDSCGVSLKVTLMFKVLMEQGDFDPWKICPMVVGRWVG